MKYSGYVDATALTSYRVRVPISMVHHRVAGKAHNAVQAAHEESHKAFLAYRPKKKWHPTVEVVVRAVRAKAEHNFELARRLAELLQTS